MFARLTHSPASSAPNEHCFAPSGHFTPPVRIYLRGAAVSLSSPSILACPERVIARFTHPYPPFPPSPSPNHSFLSSRGLSLPSISSPGLSGCRCAVRSPSQNAGPMSCHVPITAPCVSVCRCVRLRELVCHGQL